MRPLTLIHYDADRLRAYDSPVRSMAWNDLALFALVVAIQAGVWFAGATLFGLAPLPAAVVAALGALAFAAMDAGIAGSIRQSAIVSIARGIVLLPRARTSPLAPSDPERAASALVARGVPHRLPLVAKVRLAAAIPMALLASTLFMTVANTHAIDASLDEADRLERARVHESHVRPALDAEAATLEAATASAAAARASVETRRAALSARVTEHERLAAHHATAARCERVGRSATAGCPDGLTGRPSRRATPGPMEAFHLGEAERRAALVEADRAALDGLDDGVAARHDAAVVRLDAFRADRERRRDAAIDAHPDLRPATRDAVSRVAELGAIAADDPIKLVWLVVLKVVLLAFDLSFLLQTIDRPNDEYLIDAAVAHAERLDRLNDTTLESAERDRARRRRIAEVDLDITNLGVTEQHLRDAARHASPTH